MGKPGLERKKSREWEQRREGGSARARGYRAKDEVLAHLDMETAKRLNLQQDPEFMRLMHMSRKLRVRLDESPDDEALLTDYVASLRALADTFPPELLDVMDVMDA